MKNSDIEFRLKTAVEHVVPDVLADIHSRCQEQKGGVMNLPQTKKKSWRKSLIAAALVLMAGVAAGYVQHQSNQKVVSIIGLDVNPSIELKINKAEKVLAITALNEDGEIILTGMDLKGVNLNVAVNALVGSMLNKGYISELANSILISVENADRGQGSLLQQRLAEEINHLLQASSINAAVLSQTIDPDTELQALAKAYGISLGKASLIQKIAAENELLNIADLAGLSINNLNLLASGQNAQLKDVAAIGTASDKAYIGEEEAKRIAFQDAGVAESEVSGLEIELDIEKGQLVYEIEFFVKSAEYEYDLDAATGMIIKVEKDGEVIKYTGNFISEDEAKAIALAHAGVSSSSAGNIEVELEEDDDLFVYEIEFMCGDTDYLYIIDAETGAILEHEIDAEDEDEDENEDADEDDDDDEEDDDDDTDDDD
jgi:uncharacterized membrane protein YkoI